MFLTWGKDLLIMLRNTAIKNVFACKIPVLAVNKGKESRHTEVWRNRYLAVLVFIAGKGA